MKNLVFASFSRIVDALERIHQDIHIHYYGRERRFVSFECIWGKEKKKASFCFLEGLQKWPLNQKAKDTVSFHYHNNP